MSIDHSRVPIGRVRIRPSRKLRSGASKSVSRLHSKGRAGSLAQTRSVWAFRGFFHDGNWAYLAVTLVTSVVALLISVATLASSFHLTNFSAEVSDRISSNERKNSNDQRCVDSLISLRGTLSNLSAGYSLRPLDKASRLHDWDESRQALDAVTLSCGSEVTGDTETAERYAVLLTAFGKEYLRAPTGEWGNCAAPLLYDFAEVLALNVMDLPGSIERLVQLEDTEPCVT